LYRDLTGAWAQCQIVPPATDRQAKRKDTMSSIAHINRTATARRWATTVARLALVFPIVVALLLAFASGAFAGGGNSGG
jgi:hypothetical protein